MEDIYAFNTGSISKQSTSSDVDKRDNGPINPEKQWDYPFFDIENEDFNTNKNYLEWLESFKHQDLNQQLTENFNEMESNCRPQKKDKEQKKKSKRPRCDDKRDIILRRFAKLLFAKLKEMLKIEEIKAKLFPISKNFRYKTTISLIKQLFKKTVKTIFQLEYDGKTLSFSQNLFLNSINHNPKIQQFLNTPFLTFDDEDAYTNYFLSDIEKIFTKEFKNIAFTKEELIHYAKEEFKNFYKNG